MVAAAKAHILQAQQAAKPPTDRQADANACLEMFEERMDRGMPDEALRLASCAVDLFFRDGDKPGESLALSCVAQAMSAGASIQNFQQKPEGDSSAPPMYSEPAGTSGMQDNARMLDSFDLEDGYDGAVEDGGSSLALTDFTQLPISYGERLILETCMKSRSRPYDRQRQEKLSQPRRRGASAEAWGIKDGSSMEKPSSLPQGSSLGGGMSASGVPSGSVPPSSMTSQDVRLSSVQTDNLVSRLCAPKRRKAPSKPPGEEIMLMKTQERAAKLKAGGFDIASIVARLAAPRAARALSPTPGERVVLMWNRSENVRKPDLLRINAMAKPSRRGASARAWGVRQEDYPWPPPPRPPDSARAPPRPKPMPGSKDSGPSDEGISSPEGLRVLSQAEAVLPRLETQTAPASPQVQTPKPRTVVPLASRPADPPNATEDMSTTWNHPWRDRSGVDRHA